MKALATCLTILLLFVLVASAHAVVGLFDSRSVFEETLGPHELITFEEFPIGPVAPCVPIHPFIPDACVFTTQGVTFTATQSADIDQRPLLSIEQGIGAPLSRGLVSNAIPTAPDQLFLTFSHPLLGIGFDIVTGATFGTVVHVVVTEANGAVTEIPVFAVIGAGVFFGVTSDMGVTKVSLFDPTDPSAANFIIDNVAFPATAVTVLNRHQAG